MGNMPTKKVVLFLVEGITDQMALGMVLSQLIETDRVRFAVANGDLFVRGGREGPESAVRKQIQKFQSRYRLKRKDLRQVVHLIDTDGAFIPEESVLAGTNARIQYGKNCIESLYADSVRERNRTRRAAALRLSSLETVDGIPYSIFYFSRNLEHALHGREDNLSPAEKRSLSEELEDAYADCPEGFLQLLRSKEVAVQGEYAQTWQWILAAWNSLKRGSNFYLFFEERGK